VGGGDGGCRFPVVVLPEFGLRRRPRSLCGLALEPFAAHAFLRLAQTGLRFLLLAAFLLLAPRCFLKDDVGRRVHRFDIAHHFSQRTEQNADVPGHEHHFRLKPAPFRELRRQLQRLNDWFAALCGLSGTGVEGFFGDQESLA